MNGDGEFQTPIIEEQQSGKATNSYSAQLDFDGLKAIGQSVMRSMAHDGFRYNDPVELGDEVVLRLISLNLPEKDREFIGNFIFAQHGHGGGLRCSKKPPFKAFSERKARQAVQLTALSLTFSLPDDFGRGWDYRNVILYGASHAWSGSYDRDEDANFAHEALHRVAGLESSSLYVGTSCTVTFDVGSLAEEAGIRERLKRVVDAFPVRPERSITVRGANYWDALVTDEADVAAVSDMPLRAYLAQFVPLASEHPAISGDDLKKVIEEHALSNDPPSLP